jgi:hypothetical protein
MNRILVTHAIRFLTLVALAPVTVADAPPRGIAGLDRGGILAAPSGNPPELTSIAGPRFADLVPDSQKEVCRIVLEHYASEQRGLY